MKLKLLPFLIVALSLLSATQCKKDPKTDTEATLSSKLTATNNVFLEDLRAVHIEQSIAEDTKNLSQIKAALIAAPNDSDLVLKQEKLIAHLGDLNTQKSKVFESINAFIRFPKIPRPPIPQPCRSSACLPNAFEYITIPNTFKALTVQFKDKKTGRIISKLGLNEFTPFPEDKNYAVAKIEPFKGDFEMQVQSISQNGNAVDYKLSGSIPNVTH
jgi:hypothetical protein